MAAALSAATALTGDCPACLPPTLSPDKLGQRRSLGEIINNHRVSQSGRQADRDRAGWLAVTVSDLISDNKEQIFKSLLSWLGQR